MKQTSIALAAALAATISLSAKADSDRPVAVELFTSQGCYSCPPAEAYLGKLAKRPDVVALEWHVDYWDDLVYGGAGKWKDPFSSAEATTRQRDYNQSIRGQRRVYTPQMIVAGVSEAVGSNRADVERAIRQMRKAAPKETVDVRRDGNDLVISAPGVKAPLWRVDFIKEHVTVVRSGENKGKSLASHNIVRSKTRLGDAGTGALRTAAPADGMGCAIIAQKSPDAPILAAKYCPGSAASS
ncbi:MAG: DUF1223 domain-containing protein [Alphaproteobacteria bacterium]|jgi:hypothetical protein|nr:DUF1223 domain-containing protein [Alphaproteobacteria bacterium]